MFSYRNIFSVFLSRKLYTQSKVWESLTCAKKLDIEQYWSHKINDQVAPSDVVPSNDKMYVLSMFPYPSGKLHMGHVRVYTISDVLARFHRMHGKNVIHPMGWDAFGLPAENAAISQNIAPEDWTASNINYMKSQLKKLGLSVEWQRELQTCSPQYYKWTQFLFLKLFENGLVYRKESLVNWDPIDKTVLAEEQVDEKGCSWRSGAKVEKKSLKQWFVKTTKFAHSLEQGLDDLSTSDWGDIIAAQKHWIGECNGFQFEFPLLELDHTLSIWTKSPETLKTVRFIALQTGHFLDRSELHTSQTGQFIKLSLSVRNPLTKHVLPIIVTDYIEYADGNNTTLGDPVNDEKAAILASQLSLQGQTNDNECHLNGDEICEKACQENWGGFRTSSKLRDWLISRQRYWGTPIPIIHCPSCGPVPVPHDQLPVLLPHSQGSSIKRGHSALMQNQHFISTKCPKCGSSAERETDTMDTFVDSSWYFLRYLDPNNEQAPFDVQRAKDAMPVDIYIGGKEHAVLHLFYARFMSHFLHSLGWLPQREPFRRLLVQGMVMGRSYRVKGTGKYLKAEEIDFSSTKPSEKSTGNPLVVTWEKMSKSKFNGVEPETVWSEQGIDTTRLLILADVSPRSSRNWSKDTYPGILNWQDRIWSIMKEFISRSRSGNQPASQQQDHKKHEELLLDARNFYLKGVTFNILYSQQISVAISKMQGLTNSLKKTPKTVWRNSLQFEKALATQIIMLAPLAPHFASELWSAFIDNASRMSTEIHWDRNVLQQKWPQVDPDYKLDLICKVNGQENGVVKMPRHQLDLLDAPTAIQLGQQHDNFVKYYSNRKILQSSFDLYPGIQATLNLVVEQKKKPIPTTDA